MNTLKTLVEVTSGKHTWEFDIMVYFNSSQIQNYKIIIDGKEQDCPDWLEKLIDDQHLDDINLECDDHFRKTDSERFYDSEPDDQTDRFFENHPDYPMEHDFREN